MTQCPQPRDSAPAAPARRSPSTAAREAMRRRRLPAGRPRGLRHSPPAFRPNCLVPELPAPPDEAPKHANKPLRKDRSTAHALSLGMLVGITISLAIALIFQDLDSALMIMTLASILTIAYVVTRSPKRTKVKSEENTSGRYDTSQTGPHNALM